MIAKRAPLLLAIIIGCSMLPSMAATQSGGTVTVEQASPDGFSVLGNWVLLKPDGTRTTTNVTSHSYDNAPAGKYLLNVLPPSGMSVTIALTLDGETVMIDKPQAAFELTEGSTITLSIHYTLALSGKVSVDSDPPGLPYTLSGPDDASYSGLTPGFFDSMPIGLYTAQLDPIEGCTIPTPQSGRLVKDGRVVLSIQIACDHLPQIQQQMDKDNENLYVKATIDGKSVLFTDIPVGQWFTAAVRRVLDAKVMSGYRDQSGSPAGLFGPTDPVTLAELAKIAHRLASIDETKVTEPPENDEAKGTWFAAFVASAEKQGWLVFLNRSVDPLRPATRAEVVATFLQALNVKRNWPTGAMFDDVSRTVPYADCVETAAVLGLVGGYTDDKGKATGLFGPADPVNRASMAKIVSTAMEVLLKDTASFQPE